MKALTLLFSAVFCFAANASEINEQRAHFNYQMFCQGCHAPGGDSPDASVPRMKDHVGKFLNSRDGREFLVRVPGSALSALDDQELAEVLNWIVVEFSGDSLQAQFEHYTAPEVGDLRKTPLNEVAKYRAQLLAEIASNGSQQ